MRAMSHDRHSLRCSLGGQGKGRRGEVGRRGGGGGGGGEGQEEKHFLSSRGNFLSVSFPPAMKINLAC